MIKIQPFELGAIEILRNNLTSLTVKLLSTFCSWILLWYETGFDSAVMPISIYYFQGVSMVRPHSYVQELHCRWLLILLSMMARNFIFIRISKAEKFGGGWLMDFIISLIARVYDMGFCL